MSDIEFIVKYCLSNSVEVVGTRDMQFVNCLYTLNVHLVKYRNLICY